MSPKIAINPRMVLPSHARPDTCNAAALVVVKRMVCTVVLTATIVAALTSLLPPLRHNKNNNENSAYMQAGKEEVTLPCGGGFLSGSGYSSFFWGEMLFGPVVQGAWAVPPPGCSGLLSAPAAAHTILLDPADAGGYTVVFDGCAVNGSLIINSTAAGIAHLNAVVNIFNTSVASTFSIATGVLLGAGSRIHIRGLTGLTAANIAGSAQDGAELLFTFVTLFTPVTGVAHSGGLTIRGTYATQSRLLLDFCTLTTHNVASAVTVVNAVFATGSHFNITNSVLNSTSTTTAGLAALNWTGTSAAASVPAGAYPTTIIALSNTTLRGRSAFVMLATAPSIQRGALLAVSSGCTFTVIGGGAGAAASSWLDLQLKGGLVYHDRSNRFVASAAGPNSAPLGHISVSLLSNVTDDIYNSGSGVGGGQFFALQGVGAAGGQFLWNRAPAMPSRNDTIILEDVRFGAPLSLQVGQATGLNLTLRRVTQTNLLDLAPVHSLTDSTLQVEDSLFSDIQLRAPATRTAITVQRINLTGTLEFNHPATACPVRLISAVRANAVNVYQTHLQSPVRIEDVVTTWLRVQHGHTDSGVAVLRTSAQWAFIASNAWVRSVALIEDCTVTDHVRLEGTHTDGQLTVRRSTLNHLLLPSVTILARTTLAVHDSMLSTGGFEQTMLLQNTWNNATLDVLNTSIITKNWYYAIYISNAPQNGSQHRFVDSVLASTTTTYPASGTEPLQGVLVYAAGFGGGLGSGSGLLEVRGTRLQALHQLTYLLHVEVSGSRLHYDGSNVCARPGGAPNRGRLLLKTLVAGSTGDVICVNNSQVDAVAINLAACTDCEVSVYTSSLSGTFALGLAGPQTRLTHRMVNTLVTGAVTMTCSGVLRGGSVLLHALTVAGTSTITHTATAIDGGCYTAQYSSAWFIALNAALTGRTHAHFAHNKCGGIHIAGQQSNASITAERNVFSGEFSIKGTASDANVTWRIQHNNMTNGNYGIFFGTPTVVTNSTVVILNNTLQTRYGVFFQNGGAGIGPGSTLWMRENHIVSELFALKIEMYGGRLDHDSSNTYGGGNFIVYVIISGPPPASGQTNDASGHYFVLQSTAMNHFRWSRAAGLVSVNDTVLLLDVTISSSVVLEQGMCVDCLFVMERCIVSDSVGLDGVRLASSPSSSTAGLFPSSPSSSLDRSSTILLSFCRFARPVIIQGSFASASPFSPSILQLINSTFLDKVIVSATFTYNGGNSTGGTVISATNASSTATLIVGADVVNCTFQTTTSLPAGASLTFSGTITSDFAIPANNASNASSSSNVSSSSAPLAAIQVRDTMFKVMASTTAGVYVGNAGSGVLGSNSRLFLRNLLCTTGGAGVPCLKVDSLGATGMWFELWNSTFFGGGVQMTVTSAAANMRIVGNRVRAFSISGAMAAVGGGRVAACNQDSSAAGWPPLVIASVGFLTLPCTPTQMVTRCGPGTAISVVNVTSGGSVPACLPAIPTPPIAGILAGAVFLNMSGANENGSLAMMAAMCNFSDVFAPLNPPPAVPPISTPSRTVAPVSVSASVVRSASETIKSDTASNTRTFTSTPTMPSPSSSDSLAHTFLSASTTRTIDRPQPSATISTAVTDTIGTPTSSPVTTPTTSQRRNTSNGRGRSATWTAAAPQVSPTISAAHFHVATQTHMFTIPPPPSTAAPLTTPAATASTPTAAPCGLNVTAAPTETTSAVLTLLAPTTAPSSGSSGGGGSSSGLASDTFTFPIPSASLIIIRSNNTNTSGSTSIPSSGAAGNTSTTSLNATTAGRSDASILLTPAWRPVSGSALLGQWFSADIGPHVSCTVVNEQQPQQPNQPNQEEGLLVCRLHPQRLGPLPPPVAAGDDFNAAAAATLEATVQLRPCPAAPLRLFLTLVRPQPGPSASVVIFTAGLVGSTAYTLVVEPWAVEPLILAGVLDGPCAPPAVQDTARVAVFALNPFAALKPAAAGGSADPPRGRRSGRQPARCAVITYKKGGHWTKILGQGLFPRVAFAVAVAAVPGVAWAVAATLREGPHGGGPVFGVLVCTAYLVAVPCGGALVVVRLAPARYLPRRIAPSEAIWRRVAWPSGRWAAPLSPSSSSASSSESIGYKEVSAAMNLRGLTAGPRGGQLLFVGSSLLATAIFAITIAPPASASCAARHYVAAVIFLITAVVVAAFRPHRAPLTTILTTLVLIFASASLFAVGAVAGQPDGPYGPSAGLATTAMLLSILRSFHAVVSTRLTRTAMTTADLMPNCDENHQELALTVPDEDVEPTAYLKL